MHRQGRGQVPLPIQHHTPHTAMVQTARPEPEITRICQVLRPFCVAGQPLEVGAQVELHVTTATELEAAHKLQILGKPSELQATKPAKAAAKSKDPARAPAEQPAQASTQAPAPAPTE